jgi:hypothetical protein
MVSTDRSSRTNVWMPLYRLRVNVGRIYNSSFYPTPIEIKELRRVLTILIGEDDNVRTPQIPLDVILPMKRSKCPSNLVNNFLRDSGLRKKHSAVDEVHHYNEQPDADRRNLTTKPKPRRTVFIIGDFMRSGAIGRRKFNDNLLFPAIMLNRCLEHGFVRMTRSKAGRIIYFELGPIYFESPEMREYGWGNSCG